MLDRNHNGPVSVVPNKSPDPFVSQADRLFKPLPRNVNTRTLPVSAQKNEVLANILAGSYATKAICIGLAPSSVCGPLPIFTFDLFLHFSTPISSIESDTSPVLHQRLAGNLSSDTGFCPIPTVLPESCDSSPLLPNTLVLTLLSRRWFSSTTAPRSL